MIAEPEVPPEVAIRAMRRRQLTLGRNPERFGPVVVTARQSLFEGERLSLPPPFAWPDLTKPPEGRETTCACGAPVIIWRNPLTRKDVALDPEVIRADYTGQGPHVTIFCVDGSGRRLTQQDNGGIWGRKAHRHEEG